MNMFDPQGVDPEDVDPKASDSEVSFGTDDHIPPEFPEALEEDEEDDRVVALMQFFKQMLATRPEIVRGVRVWKLLRYLPSAWLHGNLNNLHALSEPTTHLDQFWSHSWHGSQWTKYANMLYLHNCMPASIAGILSASVACGLVSAGFLGARQGWCLLFGFVAFCITLLLWHARKLVFLDIACIHQTDDARRAEAIMSMGAFLNRSTSMLVLWDPTWVTRLWCIFEVAALLHSRSKADRKADLQIIPPLLGPALLGCEMLLCVQSVLYFYIESSVASSDEAIVAGERYIMLVGPLGLLFGFVTHTWRGYARSIETLQKQLREFKVEHARSACCDRGHEENSVICDREIILQCIAAWYNSLGSFESQVQTEVRMAVIDQLGYKVFTYQRALLMLTPHAWLRLEYVSSHAGDAIRQVADLAQMFTYLLAILPVVNKLGICLCYRLRARCCNPCLDFLLSMAVVIGNFTLFVACYAVQLYVFRQNEQGLLLSVTSMLSWCMVAVILWRCI
ncbi:unnamed protein product [Symbiodinium necroappetens]|uniref:Uncharacterized protein n=1 Tax=Symbiodinium necroappetens TaxID=1628268 RepID=A0A812WL66_9DINO|nr:unnamed protein product [Symbiodinium necroappetens]